MKSYTESSTNGTYRQEKGNRNRTKLVDVGLNEVVLVEAVTIQIWLLKDAKFHLHFMSLINVLSFVVY